MRGFTVAQVYAAPLSGGARAVVLLNRHFLIIHPSGAHNLTVHWKSIGIPAADMVRNQRCWIWLLASWLECECFACQ